MPHFDSFYKSEALRTCENGTVMETDPRFMTKGKVYKRILF
jgi:hypothetical protein